MPYGIHALSAWGRQPRVTYVRANLTWSEHLVCRNGMHSMISCHGGRVRR